jgi:glycosyltransferase involved in cell wall biosynthesis
MNRKINPLDEIKSIYKLFKILRNEKYDVVHTHNAKAGLIGRIAAKLAGTPLIIHTTHGLPFFEGQSKLKNIFYKVIEKIGLMFCDYFGSQNEEDLNIIKKLTKKNKIFYEGNGIDKYKMDYIYNSISEQEIKDLKKDLKISDENVIMLMGARFEKVKNHDLLLKALAQLKNNQIKNFVCILLGQGELEIHIKSMVKELQLENNIIYLGYKEDIYKYIKMADIAILTSFKEGIPRILMESMYFEKPVVATDVLGTRELVINNVTGLLSKPTDCLKLEKNIKKLILDSSLRKRMGIDGKNRIIDKFTEQLVVERLDCIYKNGIHEKLGVEDGSKIYI